MYKILNWKTRKVLSKFPTGVSENSFKRHICLLLIEGGGQYHHVLIKDVSTFMFDQKLHCKIKHICRCSFQSSRTAQILEQHVKDCIEING